jgi:hypothetical protein
LATASHTLSAASDGNTKRARQIERQEEKIGLQIERQMKGTEGKKG